MPTSRTVYLARIRPQHERPAPEAREAEQHEQTRAPATIGDNRRTSKRVIAQRQASRHRERVWRAIEDTPNFWTTLKPLGTGRRQAALPIDARAQLGGVLHHAAAGDGGRHGAVADAQVARRAGVQHAQRHSAVGRPRQVRGGAAPRLPRRRYAAELRRRAVGFVDPRHPAGGSATIRSPRAARGVLASAPRATSTTCSTCSFRRLRRAPTPRCSRNSENLSAGNN